MPKLPNVLFVRGLSRCEDHWGLFKDRFESQFGPVTCLDIPGNGKRNQEDSPTSMDVLIEDLRKKKIEKWGPEPIVGVAISLGGMTLFQWAQKYPFDFKGLVLINISLPQINSTSDRFDLARIGRLLPLFLFLKGEKKEELVFRLTSNIDDVEEKKKILARWVEIEKRYPISVKNLWRQIVLARSFKPIAHRPTVPILFLNSAKDRLVKPICSEQIAKFYQLELHRHPTAGHDLPLDDPDWILGKVQTWALTLAK